ncbi:MAG: Fe-Mn family superoxide dismutase [Candidatus Campbellbacteria bacterium]|nr:Fe-Mn family superoxide dismutase [Candidatus Campbellbacteria bacterium]
MNHYSEQQFEFHALEGISEKTMDTHLGLYSGYVKNTNKVLDLIESLRGDENNKYALLEARRRFAFEFGGMRNHEYFFEQFTEGIQEIDPESPLAQKLEEDFGSVETWKEDIVYLTGMRGIGFAILYYDREKDRLLNSWIDEQHLGHLNSAQFIFGIDMWEHAFMLDYAPSEKSSYVEAVMKNTNWRVPEERFQSARS